jgi:hypothetical protein
VPQAGKRSNRTKRDAVQSFVRPAPQARCRPHRTVMRRPRAETNGERIRFGINALTGLKPEHTAKAAIVYADCRAQ